MGDHGCLRGQDEPPVTGCFYYTFIFPDIFFIFLILFFIYLLFLRYVGLSLLWPLPLRSTGSGRAGSAAMAQGPSRSAACGIFPDRGTNPCPLHRQADSQPLRHQGSPLVPILLDLSTMSGLLTCPNGIPFSLGFCNTSLSWVSYHLSCCPFLVSFSRNVSLLPSP